MVSNLINSKGRAVANQFVISTLKGVSFQSYNSLVCTIEDGKIIFGRDWDYSKTTMKHLVSFLNQNGILFDSVAEIRKAIKNGFYDNYIVIYDENVI